MSESHESIEKRLAALVPTEPAGSIADAAYEAGRRDALAARAGRSFPAMKMAAAVVLSMGLAGVGGFVAGRGEQPSDRSPSLAAQPAMPDRQMPETEQERSLPEAPQERLERPLLVWTPWQPPQDPQDSFASPYSILSMRSAVLTADGIMLDRLPSGMGAGGETRVGSGAVSGDAAVERQRIPTPRSIDL